MKQISKIKKGLFNRNSSLLKYALKSGYAIYNNRENIPKAFEALVGKNPQDFVDELSAYKGSLTKAGQLISQYGEFYLPKEINEKLKLLHGSTHFLGFEKIKYQLPNEAMESLIIDPHPLAAASIGQVHKATDPNEGKEYVIKIQYQGIEQAIKGDLFFLKIFLNSLKFAPKGVDLSAIFTEVESVLRMEMDYLREAEILEKYRNMLNDDFYRVPRVYPSYSNQKTLCMEYLEGVPLKDLWTLDPAPEGRNVLGEKIFELFLREIFIFKVVQTDAHGGNFLVDEKLQTLFLLDFGACLEFDTEVIRFYQEFLEYSFKLEEENFFQSLEGFIDFSGYSLRYDRAVLWEYITVVSEPLRSTGYDWGKTNQPEKIMKHGKKLWETLDFNAVPAYFIYLDRKVLGVFSLLKYIGAEFDMSSIMEKVLNERDMMTKSEVKNEH
jgi:predicted unusual protein kinase regulating ubiquinone biosynthesis (AarF/ABC1/UbiB family)